MGRVGRKTLTRSIKILRYCPGRS